MEERRKINQQHKYKDKRRNAANKSQSATAAAGNNKKTTQPTRTGPGAAARTAKPQQQRLSSTSSSTSDSDDPYTTRQFSKRTIVKNWDKYERPIDGGSASLNTDPSAVAASVDDENGQMSAADFGQLLRAPAAEGVHFRFSSEKSWDSAGDAATGDLFGSGGGGGVGDAGSAAAGEQFFRMNISQMERILMQCPFYERQQYATDIFTAQELARMDGQATTARKGIDIAVLPSPRQTECKSVPIKRNVPQKIEVQQHPTSNCDDDKEADDLDALLGATTLQPDVSGTQQLAPKSVTIADPSTSIAVGNTTTAIVVDDLQQWLDDILDK